MLGRLLNRFSTRTRRYAFAALLATMYGIVVVFLIGVAKESVQSLLEARALSRMVAKAPCKVENWRNWTGPLDRTRIDLYCRYETGGSTYAGWHELPVVETNDVGLALDSALGLARRNESVPIHYDPEHPERAAFDSEPRYVVPYAFLVASLYALWRTARSALRSYRRLRELAVLEELLDRADERDAHERQKKRLREEADQHVVLGVSARNHLPAKPPPGWSVPMASKEGHGAWMIETPGVLLIAQLVSWRKRVALQVGIVPKDCVAVSDPAAIALLKHFRAVDEFEEEAARDDAESRETPWVRVFLARARVASVETWGLVQQARDQLN
jgi:hypothetical protein